MFWGGGNYTPCLKLGRIFLETSNFAPKYTPISSFRKYTFYYLGPLNFADVSVYLQKNKIFCPKKYLYSKQWCESCDRDFLVVFSVFVRKKVPITENLTFIDSLSRSRSLDFSKLAKNQKNDSDVTIFWHYVIVKFFDVVLFLFSSLVTGQSFMSISSLVLELWRFSFIRNWPEIRKSEIPPSKFRRISGDWGELLIPNLTRMSLVECYWMPQNARVTAFTVLQFWNL